MPSSTAGLVRRIFSPGLFVFGLLFIVSAPALRAEEHHWRKLEIRAKLEADGSISLKERQHMVFTGDLNGGERIFRLLTRQRLDFRGITRIDDQGHEHALQEEDDLEQVDQYSFVSRDTLRWRSRLPIDPTFDNTLLVYELDFRIRNVVVKGAEGQAPYRLDHEFVFTDRSGVIEAFTLDLEVDPSWRVVGDWRRHHETKDLQPGQGYQVELDLEWIGTGVAPVISNDPPLKAVLLLLLFGVAGGMVYLVRDFWQKQAAIGRFDPLPSLPPGEETAWILRFRPEEIGALWDRSVGPQEVAALMARWVSEGKLRTRVEETRGILGLGKKTILHLELLADRDSFVGHEFKLIAGFFFGGRTQVDTQTLKKHYDRVGFDPAGLIRQGLEDRLEAHPDWKEKAAQAPAKKPTAMLVLAGVALVLLGGLFDLEGTIFSLPFLIFPLFPVYLISGIAGRISRSAIEGVGIRVALISVPPALYLAGMALQVLISPITVDATFAYSPGYFVVAGFGLILLGIYRSILNLASSRESKEGIGTRKWLAAARHYLTSQLQQESPSFSDAMFPYLMAFGLDRQVDKWFKSFGGASTLSRQDRYRTSGGDFGAGSSSSTGSGGGFTGGGGLFGGGGATASWAVAATSVAAGVASSSSSGSSSSGGGGGSSSGGGGGGAW